MAAYRPGSIYHAASRGEEFLASLCLLLTAVLLVGLVARERRGLANIGLESMLILILYPAGILVLLWE